MKDLVIVPSFYRPEYLYLCLEAIRNAKGGENICINVYQDRHADETPEQHAELANIEAICMSHGAWLYLRQKHNYKGNAFNFLEAYREAYGGDWRYVYLVEDDVIVGNDFFAWHDAAQKLGDYFCTIAWHCERNKEVRRTTDADAVVESRHDFSSIGVCWKRENLASIVTHAVPEYYQDLGAYCRFFLPWREGDANGWCEQAGLVSRVLRLQDKPVAWSGASRVSHIGVRGYHHSNGRQFSGTITERVEALRAAIKNGELWNGLEFTPIEAAGEFDRLRVVQTI